ncbi:peptide-methionine (S)-S-oxide reductase MsrA [Fodinibius saliphilus]|uniref:peptide-methionine (S)-S-oxide reductase MsrA n=1 Tax=Fodinibius saliphilus TaxID=1920650 RepID=UPI001108763D|nr:peptide-methionine (S)-S-oxide reductase MsrA [Fodinibius saliphilus]
MNTLKLLLLISGIGLFASFSAVAQQSNNMAMEEQEKIFEEATLGAGCFWCVEAIFEEVKGVKSVVAGYAGGKIKNPSYKQVASGATDHAEVTRITYDPATVSFEQLLEVFWHTHNPTTKNRQGADVGPQYRSVIFYHNDKQKKIAQESLKKTDSTDLWKDPIVTEVEPLTNYSKAENYHQNYYENNPNAGYCTVVIAPKLKKFRKDFSHMLKENVRES